MKYAESLINFIAAYGTHSLVEGLDTDGPGPDFAGSVNSRRTAADSIVNGSPHPAGEPSMGPPTGPDGIELDDPDTADIDESADNLDAPADGEDFLWSGSLGKTWTAPQTGVDDIDLWMGGLAERTAPFGGMLGSTFNYIFETQLENLQNADRFYYLERLDGLNLLSATRSQLVRRADHAQHNGDRSRRADVFSRPDYVVQPATSSATSGPISGRPGDCRYDESSLPRPAAERHDPLHRRRMHLQGRTTDPAHVSPTAIISSEGDDTLRGNGGNDVHRRRLRQRQHDRRRRRRHPHRHLRRRRHEGRPRQRRHQRRPGLRPAAGQRGDDYIVAGNDLSEVFGGTGDDVIYIGDGGHESFGGAGNDWIEGSPQLDLLRRRREQPVPGRPERRSRRHHRRPGRQRLRLRRRRRHHGRRRPRHPALRRHARASTGPPTAANPCRSTPT